MRFSLMLASLLALSTPVLAYAQEPTVTPPAVTEPVPVKPCISPSEVVEAIVSEYPGTDVKSVSTEPPYTITFTNDGQNSDLVAHFSDGYCFTEFTTVSKVQASL